MIPSPLRPDLVLAASSVAGALLVLLTLHAAALVAKGRTR